MIDEKGRLFGKINIVDLLVLIVIVILAAALAVKLLGQGGALSGPAETTKLTYTVQVSGVYPTVYADLQKWIPGDQLMAGGELVDGSYVVGMEAKPHEDTGTIYTGDGSLTFPLEGRDLLDLTFTIEASIENTMTSQVGSQEVRTGRQHIVKTQHFELVGYVQTCEWEEDTEPAA